MVRIIDLYCLPLSGQNPARQPGAYRAWPLAGRRFTNPLAIHCTHVIARGMTALASVSN